MLEIKFLGQNRIFLLLSIYVAHKYVLRVIECFTFIDTIFISSLIILKLDFITSVK